MNAKIGVVIVNYNGKDYQNDCMRTLYASSYKNFEVIVVDSASTDNSLELLEKEYPQVHILKQNENVGVAKGNNIGIKYSMSLGTEYTLLMNNDVEVDSLLLEKLIARASESTVVVPKIFYYSPKDCIWYAGGGFDWNNAASYHEGFGEKDSHIYDKEKYVEYSPTCCMLINNKIFDSCGMIDENYFMYVDDTDFCLRLLREKIKILYVPSAILWHKVSSSTGGEQNVSKIKVYYKSRNQLYFISKFRDSFSMKSIILVYVKLIRLYLIGLVKRNNNIYVLQGYRDYKNGKFKRRDNL